MITVYSKPNCVQCDITKSELKKREIAFNEVDVSEDLEALDKILMLGYKAAPVVIAGEDSWSGFRPDKIKALC